MSNFFLEMQKRMKFVSRRGKQNYFITVKIISRAGSLGVDGQMGKAGEGRGEERRGEGKRKKKKRRRPATTKNLGLHKKDFVSNMPSNIYLKQLADIKYKILLLTGIK